jgi:PAS domain S-box-containing protein
MPGLRPDEVHPFLEWIQMKAKLSLIQTMQFGFGAALVILLVVGVVTYRELLASAASERWVEHTHQVLDHLASLRVATESAETASREAIPRLEEELRLLRALTADNPGQQRRVGLLAGLLQQPVGRGDTSLRFRRENPIPDEFRAVTRGMEDEERRLLSERSLDTERRLLETKTALGLGSFVALLIAAMAGWMVPRDYAARGRAEAAFLQSEDQLRILIDGVQDYAIFTLDPQGTVVSWNAGAGRIKGYKAEEIIGQNFSRFYSQDDIALGRPEEALRTAAASGRYETRSWRVRKDGSRFLANFVITAARDSCGVLLGFTEISRDITERQETEAKYRGLLEAAPDAIVVVNKAGEIVLLNLQAEKQFGYHRDELIGQQVKNIIPEGFAERLIADGTRTAAEALAQQIGMGIELLGRRKDGSDFPIEIMLSPLESPEGILVTAAIRDISARKRTEERLIKTVGELKRSNDELEQFAYVASHDLQEPLRMVASYTQLLAKRYRGRLDSDADEFIAYAVDGSNRMQQLIEDLLAYSRAGTEGKALRKISSERALQEALANLRLTIEESGALVTHGSLPDITTDDTQLTQVFQNLVGNAIKYRSVEVPRIHISAAAHGGNEWIFSVGDNGLGIDPKYFAKIFILFQRLHGRDAFEGTGIGLAICKKMLERLGGRIWVESQPGKVMGSTFYFALPQEVGT